MVVFYDDGVGGDSESPLSALQALAGRPGDVSPQLGPPTGSDTKRSADSAAKTHSSHLSNWRRERDAGALAALSTRKRGRKAKEVHPLERRLAQSERERVRLENRLKQADQRGQNASRLRAVKVVHDLPQALDTDHIPYDPHPAQSVLPSAGRMTARAGASFPRSTRDAWPDARIASTRASVAMFPEAPGA